MTTTTPTTDARPPVVTHDQWLKARVELLEQERELTRQRDRLNAARRRLPMTRVTKPYEFTGTNGRVSLADLFEGRRQLIVYHFMFDPADKQGPPFSEGCPGCSHVADNLPHPAHIHARNTSLVMVSRAPLEKITPFKQRMGWTVPWVSSFGSDFNYDFHVTLDESKAPVLYNYMTKDELARKGQPFHYEGESHGLSVFLREPDGLFHTYSTYGRGVDHLLNTYNLLDLTPFGRQEDWEDSPPGWPQSQGGPAWLRHHDKYEHTNPRACSSCGCGS